MATGRIGTTPVLTTRWSKAPAAGTTSLSGLDDNSVSLVYSVGYEAVYQNGVLLSRGNDYTATNGTTITLTTATVAGDIIEVFANQTIPLADTYSQTVANGKFINNTLTTTTGDIIYASAANTPARLGIGSTDQVLKVSGGVPAWGAAPAASFVGIRANGPNTSVSNSTTTTYTFDSEVFDTDNFHSNTTNNSRFTIPSGKAGYYEVTYNMVISGAAAATTVFLLVNVNGTQVQNSKFVSTTNDEKNYTVSYLLNLAVGDYVELKVWQNSGGNMWFYCNAGAGTAYMKYLGA